MSRYQNQQYVAVRTGPPLRVTTHTSIKMKFCNLTGMNFFGVVSIILLTGCILAIVLHQINSNASPTSESLKFVVVVTRHGARAPLYVYPNDPYGNITAYWPAGLGGLTVIGKQQMYKLGKTLRSFYNGFLSEHYTSKEFFAQSTMAERAYMSAATLLAGLYPPKTYQIWSPTIDWQPIPIYFTNTDKYQLALKPYLCPAFWKEQNYTRRNISIKNTKYSDLYEILTTYTGLAVNTSVNLVYIWDNLSCLYWHDMELPEWTRGVYPDKMMNHVNEIYENLVVGTKAMIRLLIGPLLNLLVNQMSGKVNGTLNLDRKIFYHSGHDLTLLGLHRVLGINDTGMVNPASSLLLELHCSEEKQYYVKMLLIKGTKATPEAIETEIPNCGTPCYFDNFMSAVNKFLVSNWDEECELMS